MGHGDRTCRRKAGVSGARRWRFPGSARWCSDLSDLSSVVYFSRRGRCLMIGVTKEDVVREARELSDLVGDVVTSATPVAVEELQAMLQRTRAAITSLRARSAAPAPAPEQMRRY